jgi:hypothetical protein
VVLNHYSIKYREWFPYNSSHTTHTHCVRPMHVGSDPQPCRSWKEIIIHKILLGRETHRDRSYTKVVNTHLISLFLYTISMWDTNFTSAFTTNNTRYKVRQSLNVEWVIFKSHQNSYNMTKRFNFSVRMIYIKNQASYWREKKTFVYWPKDFLFPVDWTQI